MGPGPTAAEQGGRHRLEQEGPGVIFSGHVGIIADTRGDNSGQGGRHRLEQEGLPYFTPVPTTHYLLPTTHYLLPTTHYLLTTTHIGSWPRSKPYPEP
jgi:hypothetical protein